jgi:hypothetical protein
MFCLSDFIYFLCRAPLSFFIVVGSSFSVEAGTWIKYSKLNALRQQALRDVIQKYIFLGLS